MLEAPVSHRIKLLIGHCLDGTARSEISVQCGEPQHKDFKKMYRNFPKQIAEDVLNKSCALLLLFHF